jgi:hypothetical protein
VDATTLPFYMLVVRLQNSESLMLISAKITKTCYVL